MDLSKVTREDHDYALSWCHDYDKGRVFYTTLVISQKLGARDGLRNILSVK